MRILHVGYAVEDLDKAIADFTFLGYIIVNNKIVNHAMNSICIYMKNDLDLIELIAPIDETSVIYELVKKNGCGPYHTCYETESIAETAKKLRKQGFIPINAHRTESDKCLFLYNVNIGIIELNEK